MTLAGAVVRYKAEEGKKLDVAPIKRDRKITQQPDERSRPIREREEKNQSEKRTAVRTGCGESTAKSHAGLDGNNVPHSFLSYRGGLGSVPL
jgi:hypothetical protein